jgi:hypothetical protein
MNLALLVNLYDTIFKKNNNFLQCGALSDIVEDTSLLGCDELSIERPMFRRSLLPPPSGSKCTWALKIQAASSSETCTNYLPVDTAPYPRRLELTELSLYQINHTPDRN